MGLKSKGTPQCVMRCEVWSPGARVESTTNLHGVASWTSEERCPKGHTSS